MTLHFQREIDKLKQMLLSLGTLAEEALYRSIESIESLNTELAEQVLHGDNAIDQLELEIEEECLKILALHQPVASDLRYIVTALKVNQELERIGDLAHHNAKRVAKIKNCQIEQELVDIKSLGNLVRLQFRKALDSFVELDLGKAQEVRSQEPMVDQKNKSIKALVYQNIAQNPANLEASMHYKTIAKNLERVADHANNIAENVIYLIEGRIARHRREEI